jgi:hypothetical protein
MICSLREASIPYSRIDARRRYKRSDSDFLFNTANANF